MSFSDNFVSQLAPPIINQFNYYSCEYSGVIDRENQSQNASYVLFF